MSRKIQQIILGKGLDDLPFGTSQSQVEEVLGKAEETDEFDMHGEKSVAWHYWNIGLSLNFDEGHDYLLSSMDIGAPEVEIFGEVLIGKDRKYVKEFLDQQNIGESEEEMQRGLSYPKANLSLWFNGGTLEEIQWGIFEE